jgi:RNA polymerase sigma factor (sigma-70 family)
MLTIQITLRDAGHMLAVQKQAFANELNRHRKILLKVARVYCRGEADRQDLIQETMIQLWHAFPRFDGRCQFSTWMYRVALNVAISWSRNEFRRNRRTRPMEQADADTLASNDAVDAAAADLDLLHTMLGGLNELDRALMLLFLEGHDQTTIATILGITSTNVATKVGRIKQRLQEQFSSPSH